MNSKEIKRRYYEDERTAEEYIRKRYGGRSGRFVNEKELAPLAEFLPKGGKILDAPCGVGRVSTWLFKKGYKEITGAEYSQAMLDKASSVLGEKLVKTDLFDLPFEDNFFDGIVSLRFVFHYPGILPFLKEAKRVLAPGGVLIFDSYRWSPLKWNVKRLGGKVFVHADKKIERCAKDLNMEILACRASFAFSPYVCAKLPYPALALLEWLEKIMPEKYRYVATWILKKR